MSEPANNQNASSPDAVLLVVAGCAPIIAIMLAIFLLLSFLLGFILHALAR